MTTKDPKLETVEIFNRLNDLVREHVSMQPNDPRNAEINTHLAELSRLILEETPDLAKSPPVKILLVEDEAITRNAFADALRREGQEVIEAADGVQALSLLDKWDVDLVITDLVIPRLNGFLLVAQIRATRPRMPVLLISGYLSQDAGRIISSGSAEFLHKPIDPPDLIATVQRLLH